MRREIGPRAGRGDVQKEQVTVIPNPDRSFRREVRMPFWSNRRRKAEMSGLDDGAHVRSKDDRSTIASHAQMLQRGTKPLACIRSAAQLFVRDCHTEETEITSAEALGSGMGRLSSLRPSRWNSIASLMRC